MSKGKQRVYVSRRSDGHYGLFTAGTLVMLLDGKYPTAADQLAVKQYAEKMGFEWVINPNLNYDGTLG